MKIAALIPARYRSTRFPGKLMRLLDGQPVILRTYRAVVQTGLFETVVVATDSVEIYDVITAAGGTAVMSRKEHHSGSDRIAEAAETIDADIIVNVQGDEPFTSRSPLEKLLALFDGEDAGQIDVASLMQELPEKEKIEDPNYVKVAVDGQGYALLFSRSPIPFPRNTATLPVRYYEHIGLYAFRKQALIDFSKTPRGYLETVEEIECLRYLENGKKIKMALTDYMGIEIDTPDDLACAEQLFRQQHPQ